ncbi:MAG: endonuclease domain-containing protein [Chloroflexi bacterium]|nr:endonuclease domain-containing protein [Chloroflexota bacterium]
MSATSRARRLRSGSTDAERVLWRLLRNREFGGWKFRRQAPIGRYVVDFVCFEKRLIVEVDGGGHQRRVHADAERTRWLEGQGFRVVRFWNNQVLGETAAVEEAVLTALETGASPSP